MSIMSELTPLETLVLIIAGIGDQLLWTEADVEESYQQKMLKNQQRVPQKKTSIPKSKKIICQTKFTDKDLLKEALKQTNVNFIESKGIISYSLPNNEIEMNKDKNDIYRLIAIGNGNKKEIEAFYEKLLGKYEQLLQKRVCDNVKEKIKNTSMQLDQEEILEDNSILLTISI